MGRSIDDIQRVSDSMLLTDKQANIASFINCIKAIVRMRGMTIWDTLANEKGLTALQLVDLVNSRDELNEKTIQPFTDKLLKDEVLLQISIPEDENIVRDNMSADSIISPPDLSRETSVSSLAPTSPGGYTASFFRAPSPHSNVTRTRRGGHNPAPTRHN